MTGSELGALSRLARRTARRNWKRTALIVALIAIPVAAAQVAAGMIAAGKVTPEERVANELGAAAVRIDALGSTPDVRQWVDEQIAALAPEADVLAYQTVFASVPGVSPWLEVTSLDLASPIAAGMAGLTEGVLPTAPNEIAVSEVILTLGDLELGDTLTVRTDVNSLSGEPIGEFTITGVVRDVLAVHRRFAVASQQDVEALLAAPTRGRLSSAAIWLVAGVGAEQVVDVVPKWEEARLGFYPVQTATARPPELAVLSEEVYSVLSAEQIAELVDMAGELEPWEIGRAHV